MSIIGLLLVLVLIGIVLTFIPIEPRMKNIIIAIVAVLAVVWLCEMFGLFTIPIGVRHYR